MATVKRPRALTAALASRCDDLGRVSRDRIDVGQHLERHDRTVTSAVHLPASTACRSADRARCGTHGPVDLRERGDEARPPGLVAGAEAGAVVAVEVLVERNAIAPVRVLLEPSPCRRTPGAGRARRAGRCAAGDRRSPSRPRGGSSACRSLSDTPRGSRRRNRHGTGSSARMSSDVHREPHRTAPVGVAAEHGAVRFGRLIGDPVFLAADVPRRRDAARATARPSGCRRDRGTPASSSMRERIRRSRSGFDDRRNRPAIGIHVLRTGRVDAGPELRNVCEAHRERPAQRRHALALRRLMIVVAQSGSRPTSERTLSRWALPSGRRRTS